MSLSSTFARLAAYVLVLVMVLGVSVPSTVLAKEFKEIDVEGDPGDGDEVDSAGGGSGDFDVPPRVNNDGRWDSVLGYRLFIVLQDGIPKVYVFSIAPEIPK